MWFLQLLLHCWTSLLESVNFYLVRKQSFVCVCVCVCMIVGLNSGPCTAGRALSHLSHTLDLNLSLCHTWIIPTSPLHLNLDILPD
jgi:hypothetical protein